MLTSRENYAPERVAQDVHRLRQDLRRYRGLLRDVSDAKARRMLLGMIENAEEHLKTLKRR